MAIAILIADDHKLFRQGLRALLSGEPDLEIVGEADNGNDAVVLANRLRPDVLLMDVTMRGLNGISASRMIDKQHTKVIGLSVHTETSLVREMIAAGASGYLLKDETFQELVNAIRVVAPVKRSSASASTGTPWLTVTRCSPRGSSRLHR